MSTTRSLLALSLLAASWVASASNWQTVPGESTLRFVGEAQGESFDGGFKDFSAHIAFDADNLESASFDVTINSARLRDSLFTDLRFCGQVDGTSLRLVQRAV